MVRPKGSTRGVKCLAPDRSGYLVCWRWRRHGRTQTKRAWRRSRQGRLGRPDDVRLPEKIAVGCAAQRSKWRRAGAILDWFAHRLRWRRGVPREGWARGRAAEGGYRTAQSRETKTPALTPN